MNKGVITKFKKWILENSTLELSESKATESSYFKNDTISIRISDHIQGSDRTKIKYDVSLVIPEESKQYIVSIGYKVYIYNTLAEVKSLLLTIFRLNKSIPEACIRNAVNEAVSKVTVKHAISYKQLESYKNKLKKENEKANKKLGELKVKVNDYNHLKTTVIKQQKSIGELLKKNNVLKNDIQESVDIISELRDNPDAREAIKIKNKTYYFDNFPKDIQELLEESIQYYNK
nr:MAG TPA: hypothetical protein [Bacteriophage sp.]